MAEENNNFEGEKELSPKEAKKQAKAQKKATRAPGWIKAMGIIFPIAAFVLAIVSGVMLAEKKTAVGIALMAAAIVLALGTGLVCMIVPTKKKKRKFVFGFVISMIALVTSISYPGMMLVSALGENQSNNNSKGSSSSSQKSSDKSGSSGSSGSKSSSGSSGSSEVDYDLAFTYANNSDGTTLKISGLTSLGHSLTNLIVPTTHEGKTVTTIGEKAFQLSGTSTKTKSITLPSTITTLEKQAFYHTTAESVSLSDNITEIPQRAFDTCAIKSITIPDSVTSIGNNAFYTCSGLTTVNIGDGTTSIGQTAFYGCTSLETVIFGDSLELIKQSAFSGCSKLKTVAFGAHAPYFESGVFYGCNAIETTTKNGLEYLGNATNEYMVLYDGMSYSSSTLTIENTCESICDNAFNEYSGGSYNGNYNIKYFTAPASLKYISVNAFAYSNIRTVSFAAGSNLKRIGGGAFFDSGLVEITLPEGLKTIEQAFGNTSVQEINIPSTVENLSFDIFIQMDSLKEINIASSHPDYSSVDGIAYNKDQSKLLRVPTGLLTGTYTLPSVAPTVASKAVLYPASDVKIVIPTAITKLESCALQDGHQGSTTDTRHITSVEYLGTCAAWEALDKSMTAGYEWACDSEHNSVSGGIKSLRFYLVKCSDGNVETY